MSKETAGYISFNYNEANFRLSTPGEAVLISSIIKNRSLLDSYITDVPAFTGALSPIPPAARGTVLPEIARRMYAASDITGLGPMASVAGGFAQTAVEEALRIAAESSSPSESPNPRPDRIVVENGGDICLWSRKEILLGIFPGSGALKMKLAFRIAPTVPESDEQTAPAPSYLPQTLAVCSSSSTMGHSLSFGKCDLAVVTGPDGFLADSAATLACNLVKKEADIQPALERVAALPGINGVLIIFRDKIGMAGSLPELVKNADPELETKVTRDLRSK